MATEIVRLFLVQLENFNTGLKRGDPTYVGVLVGVAVVFLTIVLLKFLRSRSDKNAILFVGLCESGKTLIFAQLSYGRYVKSYTSMQPNKGLYAVKNSKKKSALLQIIDVPGHERLRRQLFEHFKSTARGVVFVIDSATAQKEIRDVAEYLYSILVDKVVASGVPLLIALNKQDLPLAKSAKVVKPLLEKEINMLRVTQAAALASIDNSSSANTFLGKKGKDFEFSHLSSVRVEFAEVSAQGEGEEPDLAGIQQWMEKLI